MAQRICPYCHMPVILSPSAAYRAKKYGGKPKDYEDLFPAHSACVVRARSQASIDLMAQISRARGGSK